MIIALAGKMKSGKDTCADYLVEKGYVKISFADNLKSMCMDVFDLFWSECYTQKGKEQKLPFPIVGEEWHVRDISLWLMNNCNWSLTMEQTQAMDKALIGKKFYTAREILQYVGSEVMRMCIDKDIHAKIVKKKIDMNGWTHVVIPDCRFENEVNAVESWGGTVVRITRPETDALSGNHMSETALDHLVFEENILNNGTLEELYATLEQYI